MAERVAQEEKRYHDLIVIGGSAGSLEPLQSLLADLPADLPAAILIVIHLGAISHLAYILNKDCKLDVRQAESGQALMPGRVYVAVPDHHLLVHDGHVLVRRGPRENLSRPAIDPLFRSAAASFGGRVIGVVLSGALNDGTAGLSAIKECGGLAVVQSPEDATVPGMPLSALRLVDVDRCVDAVDMAATLSELVHKPAGLTPEIPFNVRLEAAIAAEEATGMSAEDKLGRPSHFTCPECHGTLWELDDERMLRYRCHVGHAFTGDAMLAAQAGEAEQLLWSLLRSHRERAALARSLAKKEREQNRHSLADDLMARAESYQEDADLVEQLIQRDRAAMDTGGTEQPG